MLGLCPGGDTVGGVIGDRCNVFFTHNKIIVVGPAHDVGVHLGELILHFGIEGDAFDAINNQRLQHGRIANALVSAKGRESPAHALCPIAGAEFSTRLRFAFDNDFFHFIIITIRSIRVVECRTAAIMYALIPECVLNCRHYSVPVGQTG